MIRGVRRLLLHGLNGSGDRRFGVGALPNRVGWWDHAVGETWNHVWLEIPLPAGRRWALCGCAGQRRLPLTGGGLRRIALHRRGLCTLAVGFCRVPGLGDRTGARSVVALVRQRTVRDGSLHILHGLDSGDRHSATCAMGRGIGWWHQSIDNTRHNQLGPRLEGALPAGRRQALGGCAGQGRLNRTESGLLYVLPHRRCPLLLSPRLGVRTATRSILALSMR